MSGFAEGFAPEYVCTCIISPKLTFGKVYMANPYDGAFWYDDGTPGSMEDCSALFKKVVK